MRLELDENLPTGLATDLAGRDHDADIVIDDLELVHKDDLEDRRGVLSPATMREIDRALRGTLSLG